MRISIVVAVAKNGIIGRGGGLAWKISDDLKWFREITTGHPIIMGRKTFDSIGKPLPKRSNIVVSGTLRDREGVLIAGSVDDALKMAFDEAARLSVEEVFIIGGADIYQKTLPSVDRLYLTEVDAAVEGDVSFPTLDPADWRKLHVGRAEKSDRNEYACDFFILDRR